MLADLIVQCSAQECYVNVLAYLQARSFVRVHVSAELVDPQECTVEDYVHDIIISVLPLIDEGKLLHECMKIGVAHLMTWLRQTKASLTTLYVFHGVAAPIAHAKRFVC